MKCALLSLAVAGWLLGGQSLSELYDEHEWFRLRDAIAQAEAPLLYRGAVAYAFRDLAHAEQYLRLAMKTGAGSEQANDAGAFLISLSQIRGDYRQALFSVRALQAMNGGVRGLDDAATVFTALSAFSKQKVSRRRVVNVAYSMRDGNLFIPVSINGKTANLYG